MSPKQMVRPQSEMGKQLEGKVNVWKSQIEERKGAQLLLQEIKIKQVPDRMETDMEIVTEVQVDKNTVLGYNNFTPQGHEYLLREIEGVCPQAFPSFPSPSPSFTFWLSFQFSRG